MKLGKGFSKFRLDSFYIKPLEGESHMLIKSQIVKVAGRNCMITDIEHGHDIELVLVTHNADDYIVLDDLIEYDYMELFGFSKVGHIYYTGIVKAIMEKRAALADRLIRGGSR